MRTKESRFIILFTVSSVAFVTLTLLATFYSYSVSQNKPGPGVTTFTCAQVSHPKGPAVRCANAEVICYEFPKPINQTECVGR